MLTLTQSLTEVLGEYDLKDAKQDLDRLFLALDLDGDGVVSLNEFFEANRIGHVQRWVRQVATRTLTLTLTAALTLTL